MGNIGDLTREDVVIWLGRGPGKDRPAEQMKYYRVRHDYSRKQIDEFLSSYSDDEVESLLVEVDRRFGIAFDGLFAEPGIHHVPDYDRMWGKIEKRLKDDGIID